MGNSQENALGRGLDDLEPIEGTGGRLRKNGEQIIICFGKHKSRNILAIAKEDPSYIRWLCSPASPLNNDARNLIRNML